ncbi:protein tyrosine phosphatase [Pontivivens insulae]|nr:protein tyrosine phosphatase [Pontivivens insulae]
MKDRILFVCLGNICRSPAAEAVMRAKAPHLTVDSAGTAGWHQGKAPDTRARAEGARRGYVYDDLRARQVTRADFERFDVIYAMDHDNLADLRAIADGPARLELFLGDTDVPDPYYDNSFPRMFDLIEARCDALLRG